MVSRGNVSDDLAYVLLDTPLVPRLDLSDCRPTELPVLLEATPSQRSDHAPKSSGARKEGGASGRLSAGHERDYMPVVLPRRPADSCVVKTQVPPATEVRTLVVDMTDLEKVSFNSSDIEDSSDEIVLEDPIPAHIGKRQGGVLKGGEDYVSTGEPRPRPRVSFLLDAAPGQGQEGGAVQIRVYAKPPQLPPDDDEPPQGSQSRVSQHPSSAHQHRINSTQHRDNVVVTGLPPKRFRPLGSADRRHSASSYRQQIRQMQAEARLHEAYAAASRSAEGNYRLRRPLYEDHPLSNYSPQLPSVSGSQSSRRVPLFSFKRKASADLLLPSQASTQQEERRRKQFVLPHNAGSRPVKGQVRFQEDAYPGGVDRASSEDFVDLHSRHAEPRHISCHHQGSVPTVGSYSIVDRPSHTRTTSSKPPIPRAHAVSNATSLETTQGNLTRQGRVTSANSRRVREWLSVDSVPPHRNKPRPSTVSSASSSTRSRDIHSAQHRMAGGSSRVSSASLKAASDPGVDLENMDLVTLNMMARRCKGPSRYRYLAKLRSLNLNTPRPLA